jgi:outer membrane lipase/esterase
MNICCRIRRSLPPSRIIGNSERRVSPPLVIAGHEAPAGSQLCDQSMHLGSRATHPRHWMRALALVLLVQAWHSTAVAQAPPGCTRVGNEGAAQPCLTTLVSSGIFGFNGLEIAAARADDTAFASLLGICGATGAGCSGAQFNLFTRLREIEDNAKELLGFGVFADSLHLSAQGVGFALRWTADEEFGAQSSVTSRFANNQLAAVSSRLNVLRFAQTLRLARADTWGIDGYLADVSDDAATSLGGGASADSVSAEYGKWSAFANAAYGRGTKAPTTFDDAFDFGGTQVSAGADRRLSRHMVVGFLVNYLHQQADFNPSESVASGGIHSTGWGATGYLQMDWDAAYLNFSVGGQRLSLDTNRLVAYPSNNPLIRAVDTTFFSDTHATSWLATLGSGYVFHARGFSAEPYLSGQLLRTAIGGFSESTSGQDVGFAATVHGQTVTSLVGVAGMKFQYTLLPSFGVIVPYAYGEYRREFRNPSQNVPSRFLSTASAGDYFQLPTDSIKPDFYEVGAGITTVLPHGVQAFVQYMKVLQLQYFTDYVVSGGFRYEF